MLLRRKLPLLALLTILITVLGGCLPSRPKEILGPTWESQYRIPIIRAKKISLGAEDGGGLDSEKVSIKYRSSSKERAEPLTFDLFEERVTVDPGTIIPDLSLLPIEGESPADSVSTSFSFGGLENYAEVTLSSEATRYNYIELTLKEAQASPLGQGLMIHFYSGKPEEGDPESRTIQKVTIPPGEYSARLDLSGLTISPDNNKFTITVAGSYGKEGANPAIEFDLGELEIEKFTVKEFNEAILEDLNLEALEIESVQLREDDADLFEIKLKTADFSFTPVLPEGLILNTAFVIEALDHAGNKIEGTSWPITLKNGESNDFPGFKEALNGILKDGSHSLNIRLEEITPSTAKDAVTITYPGEIRLEHDLTLELESLTYGASFEGPDGSIDLEDVPLEINEVNLNFDVENNSPFGLDVEFWLSPNPIKDQPKETDPKVIKIALTIKPWDEEMKGKDRFVISFDPDKFTDLIEAQTIYHRITIINKTETDEAIEADDYLAITAWADATCIINKR